MKMQDLLEELEEKGCYKKFKSENPSAFFSAGFLILNLKDKSETIQLDFFLPEQNRDCSNQSKSQINEGKIVAFEHPFNEPKIFNEEIKQMQPQTTDIKIDIDDLEPICKTTIKENNSSVVPTKIIAILKDNQWNLTCMDDMLGIVQIKINAITEEQSEFKKGSLMDFMGIKKK